MLVGELFSQQRNREVGFRKHSLRCVHHLDRLSIQPQIHHQLDRHECILRLQ